MLTLILFIFVIVAALGATLLFYVLSNKETPKAVTFTHGSLAVFGVLLLCFFAIFTEQSLSPTPWLPIILFLAAASGGFYLVFRDVTGRSIPKSLAIGHGLIALCGFISLIVIFYNLS